MSVAKIFLVVLIIALCSSFAALGQGVLKLGDDTEFAADTNLLIDAQVLLGGKPVKNVTVFVVHKGSVIKEAKTQNDGFFQLKVGFDTLVTLKFYKEGYLPIIKLKFQSCVRRMMFTCAIPSMHLIPLKI